MAFSTPQRNLVLRESVFDRAGVTTPSVATLSARGVAVKTGALLVLVVASGSVTWDMIARNPAAAMPWMIGGAIGGLVMSLIAGFAPSTGVWSAPLYAVAEGLFLGGLSSVFERRFPGIVVNAVLLSLGGLVSTLSLYRAGVLRASGTVMKVVSFATVGIGLVYLVSMLMRLFGSGGLSIIWSDSPIGILFSVGVCVVAVLNFVWDFEFIEDRARAGAPKSLEWLASLGILLTLVWVYIEVLRLLSKLNRRR